MRLFRYSARAALLLAAGALCAGAVIAQAPSATVPPAIQQLRRHMLDTDVNSLTFRNMDALFDTLPVARAGPVAELPVDLRPLASTYSFNGTTRPVEEGLARTYTNALLVIRGGRIVQERYFNRTGPDTRFISWSMAKSITSLLVGIAIEDGAIRDIDDPVTAYVPELASTGYDGVTVRQLLQMRSGVGWDERYDFENTENPATMIFEGALVTGRQHYADAALTVARQHAPGDVFNYSTVETAVLGWVLERAIRRDVAGYMSERLWQPLGAEADGFWIADGPLGVGRAFTGGGFNARLRDYGRLGLMVLNRGRAGQRQIVPAAWIAESTRSYAGPGRTPEGPIDYGYQWWTLKGTNAFYAHGLQGQFIFIDPDSDTVIVKLSHNPPGSTDVTLETGALLRAIAAGG